MISSCVQAEVVEGLDKKVTTQKSVVAELKQRLKKGQQTKQLEDVQAAKRQLEQEGEGMGAGGSKRQQIADRSAADRGGMVAYVATLSEGGVGKLAPDDARARLATRAAAKPTARTHEHPLPTDPSGDDDSDGEDGDRDSRKPSAAAAAEDEGSEEQAEEEAKEQPAKVAAKAAEPQREEVD